MKLRLKRRNLWFEYGLSDIMNMRNHVHRSHYLCGTQTVVGDCIKVMIPFVMHRQMSANVQSATQVNMHHLYISNIFVI